MEEEFIDPDEEELEEDEELEKPRKKKTVKKKVSNNGINLVEVPTEFQKAFQLPDGKVLDLNQYLTWLGNEIHEIKRAVA